MGDEGEQPHIRFQERLELFLSLRWKLEKARDSGIVSKLAEAGRRLDRKLDVRCVSLSYDDAYACAITIIQSGADAIFAIDDVMAAAAIGAALDLGLRVPEDIGVVGYDDTPMASWRTLSLTSVDQRTVEMGRHAADMILRRIEHPEEEVLPLTLTPRLVVRGSSTGPRPRRRRRTASVRVESGA